MLITVLNVWHFTKQIFLLISRETYKIGRESLIRIGVRNEMPEMQ